MLIIVDEVGIMNTPEQICRDCKHPKPLTEEFWYRDKSSETGFARHRCRICSRKYMSTEARLARKERRELAALNTREPEVFGAFEARALAREIKVKTQSFVFSIDREV